MTVRKNLATVLQRNLRQALRAGDAEQAGPLLQRLKTEDPLSLETRGLELEYLLLTEHREEARLLADQLLTLHPGSARIHYLAGRMEYQGRRYAQALAHFSESNRLFPHWRTRLWRGKSLTQLGRYGEAEGLLLELHATHPKVGRDLAWLYERMGEEERALHYLERYLESWPDDPLALEQQQRLRSHLLPADELLEEVETLAELGEEIPPQMFATYLQRLLERGESGAARRLVEERLPRMESREAASLAWIAYRLHAYDLALQLFLAGLPGQLENFKYLQSLESTARKCNRTAELIPIYEQYAPEEKRLYGRIRRLEREGTPPPPPTD